jgi:hypothetical protein
MESLSSWLERHANYYKVSMETLFASGLNMNPVKNIIEVDFCKNKKLFLQIEKNTGIKEDILDKMILESFSPRIFDFVGVHTRKNIENYTNTFRSFYWVNNRQLINKIDIYKETDIIPWIRDTPWSKGTIIDRFCSKCMQENKKYKILAWRLCVLSTCPEHNCYLVEKSTMTSNKTNNMNKKIFPFQNTEPENSLLELDKMTMNAIEHGQVILTNENKMSDMIWFRFLRGLAKKICVNKNICNYEKRIFDATWKDISIEVDYRTYFECLEQEERATIMTLVGRLISNWPKNIIERINSDEMSYLQYHLRNHMPYELSKNFDFIMHYPDSSNFNCEFFSNSRRLNIEGLLIEMKLDLIENKYSRDMLIGFLTYNGRISEDEAKLLIENICNNNQNRAGATAYDTGKKVDKILRGRGIPIHQIRSMNSPPIEERDHHDLPVYNEL